MIEDTFNRLTKKVYEKSFKVLQEKSLHYSRFDDRLIQFKRIAEETGKNPTECLIDMAQKHWSALREMAKSPQSYDSEIWQEHCIDAMNYCGPLMLALINDLYDDTFLLKD